jgi:hypothetical protein
MKGGGCSIIVASHPTSPSWVCCPPLWTGYCQPAVVNIVENGVGLSRFGSDAVAI